jgi:hypothetical protein
MLSCETYFSICFDFFQLPDGRWAGRCTNFEYECLYVSIASYAKNETPERFKYEPCELADQAVSSLYYKLTY